MAMRYNYAKLARQNKASGSTTKVVHGTKWFEDQLRSTLIRSTDETGTKQQAAVDRAVKGGVSQKRIAEIHKEANVSKTKV